MHSHEEWDFLEFGLARPARELVSTTRIAGMV
jgi:hypothetical protein